MVNAYQWKDSWNDTPIVLGIAVVLAVISKRQLECEYLLYADSCVDRLNAEVGRDSALCLMRSNPHLLMPQAAKDYARQPRLY